VGDRVEVLSGGSLCPAEVMKCHSTGEDDVVYEKDGTERTLVTREEHRLRPLEKGGRGKGSGAKEASWSEEEEEVHNWRMHQAGGCERRVHPARCVRDVPDWRLHHHGCEQVAALQQARCPRVVQGARVSN
jgi:hypothetical protein